MSYSHGGMNDQLRVPSRNQLQHGLDGIAVTFRQNGRSFSLECAVLGGGGADRGSSSSRFLPPAIRIDHVPSLAV
jgi:hypothetical protein